MKKFYVGGAIALVIITVTSLVVFRSSGQQEQVHYERGETELLLSNMAGATVKLFRAGRNLEDVAAIPLSSDNVWLPRGRYFLQVEQHGRSLFYPVPIIDYRAGPDENGTFSVTLRSPSAESPPRLLTNTPEFSYIPNGNFLIGDRLNKQEPHYVWLTGFFLAPFEITNAEFREFLNDPSGYNDSSSWTQAGWQWKTANSSRATALLKPSDPDFKRFGQPDQPVVQVNWFEANAFCRWLTRKIGQGKWIYVMPTDAEWEKAARGPDDFEYALGMTISDAETPLYNWKKNPGADITVVGLQQTFAKYQPNRYGLYHMTGNVAEWTQSVYRPYNRQRPYVDDDRNHDDTPGARVVRGGSWYTASIAVLYIPYRENFQPELSAPYLGFRVAARLLP